MRLGSLFAGVGGMDHGVELGLPGSTCVWQVEREADCRLVLAHHWPEADRSVRDVTQAGRHNLERVDLVIGGFPCVDVSSAGKREGLAGERSGLWYEQRRIIEELSPRWAIVENVASGKGAWLCEVRSDLHALGYRTAAVAVSAADVGAPHERARIFVVGYAAHQGLTQQGDAWAQEWRRAHDAGASELADAAGSRREGSSGADVPGGQQPVSSGALPDADSEQLRLDEQRKPWRRTRELRDEGNAELAGPCAEGMGRSAQSRLGRAASGPACRLDASAAAAGADHAWPAPRGAEQLPHEPPRIVRPSRGDNRTRRLMALGNICVPQCAAVPARMIAAVEAGEAWESVFE